ncbi:uncharacterized protein LOC113531599 [Pangasianodon hypophthalmus]|uniref:uncharacterized protein LOC113531599 n=1 Tax=Pangasianodon hypophthalmus TaxID=310915 RepID=UPI002307D020|nr:uncharacterized protein LOC113531599 [Pangasianodon hypophthalmus]
MWCPAYFVHTFKKKKKNLGSDVPQFSPSSSCNTTQDLILCSCEIHGNPSPKLEWRLSGQTVLPSEATPIQVESVGNTSLRRSILFSIPQSVKDTPTLQCVGSNNLGNASQVFFFITKAQRPAEGSGVDISSVLIGLAVGASVMMMMCGVFLYVRTKNPFGQGDTVNPSGQGDIVNPSGQGDTAGLILNDKKEDEESVYANKTSLLSESLQSESHQSESLHYSSVIFPNRAGSEIRGLSSLTDEYALIQHGSKQQTKGETGEAAFKEGQDENVIKLDRVMMQKSAEEEVMYGNITRQPKMETKANLDKDDKIEKSKETKEAKERASEQLKHSDGAESIYAQVKPRKRENK